MLPGILIQLSAQVTFSYAPSAIDAVYRALSFCSCTLRRRLAFSLSASAGAPSFAFLRASARREGWVAFPFHEGPRTAICNSALTGVSFLRRLFLMVRVPVQLLQIFCLAVFICVCSAAFGANPQNQATQNQPAQNQSTQAVPKIDGGVGACTANFTIRDGANKPLYNAEISVQLRYGFMNMRKTDLQVSTDSNGKANFTGLPNFPKKPLEFHIKSGTVSKTVSDDPSENCTATFDVVLTVH
ncbi:MAG: hypothetical protein WBD87_13245 [Candidatus Acidiferrales bacterium]